VVDPTLDARIAAAITIHGRGSDARADREDLATAADIVERLFPQPGPRRDVIAVLGELIDRAHRRGDRRWAITLFAAKARLNVGMVHVAVLLPGVLFLPVDPARLDEATRTALGPRLHRTRDFAFTITAAELYIPAGEVAALWPALRDAALAYVDSAAERDTSFYNSHSPGLVAYLERELGRPLPRPADRRPVDEPIDLEATLARARRSLPPERVVTRERALADARALIESNRRSLSVDALTRLMRFFNTDHERGRDLNNRFGQAMVGYSRNRIVEHTEIANHWIDTLWACESDADVAGAIDRLRRDAPLPQSGLSFPTMILHCKDPTRWFPAQSGALARGYARLTGSEPVDGASYVRTCEALRTLVATHALPVVGLDVLALSTSEPESVEPAAATAPAEPQPPTPPTASPSPSPPAYTRDDFLAETLFDDGDLAEIEAKLRDKPQLVVYGPPGTGKTWIAERLARLRTGGDRSRIEIIQFHPNYGYEDFIEGIRPTPEGDRMTYPVVPGVFLEFCARAAADPTHEYVLVIDEINRGNLPRIFGELLFALERRGEPVKLSQSRRLMTVPTNLVVLGTMNTADQSIALLDMALRRRFHFERLEPDPDRLTRWLERHAPRMRPVAAVMRALNTQLQQHNVTRDRHVGHTHFMRPGLDEDALARIWRGSIMPLIEELFPGQDTVIASYEHAVFVEPRLTDKPRA